MRIRRSSRRPDRSLRTAGVVLLLSLAGPSAALAQCAMCGTAIGSSGYARGFAISVIFLLITLLLVVLGFVGLVVSQARTRDASRPEAAAHRASRSSGRSSVAGW